MSNTNEGNLSTPENQPDARTARLDELEAQIAELKAATANTPAPTSPNPAQDWQKLSESQAERIKHLESVIQAGKLAPVAPHPNRDAKPALTAAQLQAQWGNMRFLHKSSRAEKIAAFGEDPSAIDDNFLRKCFGRGSTGIEASELAKRDPYRLRVLREIALALGIYGK